MRPIKLNRGDRFGHWTVLEPNLNLPGKAGLFSQCICSCGKVEYVPNPSLAGGRTKSCGCATRVYDKVNVGEKVSGTKLYNTWLNMQKRCYSPSVPSYKNYGAKGIGICEEWRNDFKAFESWALSHGYSENLTIERIDYNKGYSPDNCKWATYLEQGNNKRNNVFITYDGKRLTVSQWARELGMKRNALYARLYKYGWSVEKAFTTPIRKDRRYTKSAV